jgi:hypothetical protein
MILSQDLLNHMNVTCFWICAHLFSYRRADQGIIAYLDRSIEFDNNEYIVSE